MDITYNLMVMDAGQTHYAKAGQARLAREPVPGAELRLAIGGELRPCRVEQVYIPPGCGEHCIGTLFICVL